MTRRCRPRFAKFPMRWPAAAISANRSIPSAARSRRQQAIARLARLRYREGVANYLEVLDAERNLFSAQQTLLETMRTNDQNDVSLFIALGGGFGPERAPAAAVVPDREYP